jgi:two-component system response regulator YesN
MYKVLIVDDEEPVLESYEFMLKSSGDFAAAGKARTGFEALKYIYENEPDLVFMDINIPGLDGLEVITEVRKKYPAMIFILSTAYERFDLAQRAIPLGVFAYLVKPVSKKTFYAALEEVRETLKSREAEPKLRIDEDPEKQFLRKTIWKKMSPEDWAKYRERFSLPSDKGIVLMMEIKEAGEQWAARIAERLSFRHRYRYDLMGNRALFLISGELGREALRKQMEELLKDIDPESVCTCGTGEMRNGPELYLSCAGALEELQAKLNRSDILTRERLKIVQLRHKIGIADPDEVRKLFRSLWEDIFHAGDMALAKAKMTGVFMILIDDSFGAYSAQSGDGPPFNPAEEILALGNSIEEWSAWAEEAFEILLYQAALRRSGNFPPPLTRAVGYIHDHYAEPIQLSSAADAAQVSSAYLSRLFSEHLKTSFVDYLTELRVEKAEKLIPASRMSIKEIAFAVGYQDPNYFSKIFKKITGLLPTEYMKVKIGYAGEV